MTINELLKTQDLHHYTDEMFDQWHQAYPLFTDSEEDKSNMVSNLLWIHNVDLEMEAAKKLGAASEYTRLADKKEELINGICEKYEGLC